MKGVVYLIGAGPGDPGLLTLRGAELLGRAEVVLYDGLSNADILAHAPAAEQICVGKHGQHRLWTQAEIIDEMLRFAQQGKIVVRLKGGDPAVFARSAEEVTALQAAGIPSKLCPESLPLWPPAATRESRSPVAASHPQSLWSLATKSPARPNRRSTGSLWQNSLARWSFIWVSPRLRFGPDNSSMAVSRPRRPLRFFVAVRCPTSEPSAAGWIK